MHGQIVKGGWVGWGTRYPCPPTIKTYQINLIKNLELSQEAKPTSDIPLQVPFPPPGKIPCQLTVCGYSRNITDRTVV